MSEKLSQVLDKYSREDTEAGEAFNLFIHSLNKKRARTVSAMLERIKPKIKGKIFLKMYRVDGTVWGRIQKYVKKIIGPGFIFVPDPEAEDKETAEREARELNKWKTSVKLVDLMRIVVKDIFIFGRGFLCLCLNALEDDIIHLHTIDPLEIDYQRDKTTQRPLVDEYGRPRGFVWEGEGYIRKVEFDREEIAHFRFFPHSELDLGQSPLEPLYNVIKSKGNFEVAAGEVLFRKAFPLYVLYVGDPQHIPPQAALSAAEKEFVDLDRVTEMVLPFYYKLVKIEASKMEELRDYHAMFKDVIYEGFLSRPRTGLRGRRRLVDLAQIEEEEIVRDFQSELSDQILDQITKRVCKIRKYKTLPRTLFYEVKPATQLQFARTIGIFYRYGALTHDIPSENWIRQYYGMPLKETGIGTT